MLNSKIEVKKSQLYYLGLFAKVPITKGEMIWQLDKSAKRYTPEKCHRLPYEQKELGC